MLDDLISDALGIERAARNKPPRLVTFPHCECAGVPSGTVVRVAPVLFVRDSIPE
jgi:hypothetical protein